jgi:Flp pilus assembly pilin Flp
MDKIYTMMAVFFTGMYDRDESDDRGAGMVEYALLVALIGVLLIGSLAALRGGIATTFTNAVNALTGK